MNPDRTTTLYSGRATSWGSLWITTALVAPLLVMADASSGSWSEPAFAVPVAVVVVAGVVNLLTLSSVRTLAGPNGVTVHFGAFGRPRWRFPLERIQHLEAVHIPVSRWAWGITWSPRRGLMLTIRNGPALQLTLTNGRMVTISAPHPEDAVTAIADARDARRPVPSG